MLGAAAGAVEGDWEKDRAKSGVERETAAEEVRESPYLGGR